MSTFWIFAAILTVVYVAYYIITICVDLYRKPHDQNNASAEYFEVDDTPTESSKAVEETESGFRVGTDNDSGGNTWQETDLHSALVNKPEINEQDTKLDASGAPITPAQKKIGATYNDMEETEVEQTGELMEAAMKSAMTHGEPPIPIKKTIIEPISTDSKNEKGHDDNEIQEVHDNI